MNSNVTDMNGNPINPDGEEEFDTYKVRFFDLNEEDGTEYIHTAYIKAAPIMTSTYVGFAVEPSSVELLIPFERLLTLQKVETAETSDGQTAQ
jgi:hypothetical protein